MTDSNMPMKKREFRNNHFDSTIWNEFKFRDDDIILATYGKSGTTWTQQILSQLLSGGNPDGVNADVPLPKMSPWMDLRVPPKEVKLEAVEKQKNRRFVKTHLPVDALVFSPKAKYIFVARDGRDVAWSFFNHHRKGNDLWYQMLNDTPGLVGEPFPRFSSTDVKEYYQEWFEKDGKPWWPFFDFISSWWEIRNLPNVMFVHYSDMKKDMNGEIRRIASFLDITVEEDKWDDIYKHCSFEYMKENASKFTVFGGKLFDGGAKSFINKGTNGRWADVLTKEEIEKYEMKAVSKLGEDCARWLAHGGDVKQQMKKPMMAPKMKDTAMTTGMNHTSMSGDVLIIGGGPSGLAALKEMREVGIDASLVEMASSVGGVFRKDAVYEGMHLTISNRFMAYSDFPDHLPARYSTSDEYVAYLEKYATRFRLWDRITFNSNVKNVKMTMGKWKVEIECDGVTRTHTFNRLIVATGSNQVPKYAPTPGFKGEVMHSKDFKNASDFKGKRVLVIGIGESSSDIVAEVSKVAKSCTNWSRRPLLIGPRWLSPKSNDEQTHLLAQEKGPRQQIWEFLETATTSKLANLMSPRMYSDLRINLWKGGVAKNDKSALHLLCNLCLHGCEKAPRGMELSDQLFVITKSNRMSHAVSVGDADLIVAKSATYEGKKVRFDQCLVKNFDTNPDATQEMEVDVIIMCTGFETKIDWIDAPYINPNPRTWFKNSIPPGYEDSLAFLGWTRPHQGGIPCCSEMLSRYLALLYTGQRELPRDWRRQIPDDAEVAENYWTQGTQYKTIVDYPSFMESMAKLIGCVPQPPSILNFRRFVQYYTFPFWPHFYRLNGVGAKPKVVESVLSEYGTFEAISPPVWHPIFNPSQHLIIWTILLNPVFYLLSFLPRVNGFEAGWDWARSKQYAGLHGVRITAKDMTKDVILPLLPLACLVVGCVAYYAM